MVAKETARKGFTPFTKGMVTLFFAFWGAVGFAQIGEWMWEVQQQQAENEVMRMKREKATIPKRRPAPKFLNPPTDSMEKLRRERAERGRYGRV